MLTYHSRAYAIGQVAYPHIESCLSIEQIHRCKLLPYGNTMVEKRFLQEVNGYAENLIFPGGYDDNLHARLDLLGLQKMLVSQAVGIHRQQNLPGHHWEYLTNTVMPAETYQAIYYPKQIQENRNDREIVSGEVAYRSETRTCKKNQCEDYLHAFKEYWIRDDRIFQKKYIIVALIQVRNELQYLPEVLLHLDHYCDGIILLDDGSTDGSYEAAMSEKLLLKVKKLPEALFNDLKLRNITLDLAAFIDAEWLFFFDADERFHEAYADLYSIANRQDMDSVSFSVIHLWNDESCYKVNLPERTDGILSRLRMFRSYGHLQIIANRILHFPAVPFQQRRYHAPVLIKHYGNIDPATRKMKYERYTKQDQEGLTQGYSYDYLIEEHADLKSVANLSIDFLSK
jgi:hypothetical protein